MSWSLQLNTGPAVEPVTLAEAKAHLRVTFTDDDAYITALITAAREIVERDTERALITQTWTMFHDVFPALQFITMENWRVSPDYMRAGDIVIPKSPLQSVQSILWLDYTSTYQTLASSVYIVDTAREPARIALKFGQLWPITLPQPNAVQINFTAGYGTTEASVPQSLQLAMKLLIAHWYENREPISSTGAVPKQIELTYEALIWRFRAMSIA